MIQTLNTNVTVFTMVHIFRLVYLACATESSVRHRTVFGISSLNVVCLLLVCVFTFEYSINQLLRDAWVLKDPSEQQTKVDTYRSIIQVDKPSNIRC